MIRVHLSDVLNLVVGLDSEPLRLVLVVLLLLLLYFQPSFEVLLNLFIVLRLTFLLLDEPPLLVDHVVDVSFILVINLRLQLLPHLLLPPSVLFLDYNVVDDRILGGEAVAESLVGFLLIR